MFLTLRIPEMHCKITAILSNMKKNVITRHSFCVKQKYSDKNTIFVTKYINKYFRHTIKYDKL